MRGHTTQSARFLQRLVAAERAADPFSGAHIEALILMAALRLHVGDAAERAAAEASLSELVAELGDRRVQVTSALDGRTFEAGWLALTFLARFASADPLRLSEARAWQAAAERRQAMGD